MASTGTRRQAHFSGSVSAVTTAGGALLRPAYLGRLSIHISNSGATDAWVALELDNQPEGSTPVPVVGNGYYLKSGGPPLVLLNYTGAIAVLGVTTATNIAVLEI